MQTNLKQNNFKPPRTTPHNKMLIDAHFCKIVQNYAIYAKILLEKKTRLLKFMFSLFNYIFLWAWKKGVPDKDSGRACPLGLKPRTHQVPY